jgi:hypothetical protein
MNSNKIKVLQDALHRYSRSGFNIPNSSNPRHIKLYKELVYDSFDNELSKIFILTKKTFGIYNWRNIIIFFISSYDCDFQFKWMLPLKFHNFLINHKLYKIINICYLYDLIQFEACKYEIMIMKDMFFKSNLYELTNHSYIINPESKKIIFKFPVHIKKPEDILESDKKLFKIVIYRDCNSKNLKLIELDHFKSKIYNLLKTESFEKELLIDKFKEIDKKSIEFAIEEMLTCSLVLLI